MRLHPPLQSLGAAWRAVRELRPVGLETLEVGVRAEVEHDLVLGDERLEAGVETRSATKKSTRSIADAGLDRKDDDEVQEFPLDARATICEGAFVKSCRPSGRQDLAFEGTF